MMYDGVINKPSLDEALEHYGVKGMKWDKKKRKWQNRSYKGTGKLSSKFDQLIGKVKNRKKNSYIPSFTSAMAGDSRYNRPSDGMYNDPRYKKSKKRF